MGFFTWLSAVATTLFAINQGAEIGHKIQVGVREGKKRRAERRVQATPSRAARWLEEGLRQQGHPVTVKPGLVGSSWSLLASYPTDTGLRPPAEFEGYPVVFQVARSRKDRKAAALSA